MPVCHGCKQMTCDQTRCVRCKKFCCKGCLLFPEDIEHSEKCCPDCATNNNANTGEEYSEVEPGDVLQSVKSVWWRNKFFKSTIGKGVDKKTVYCRLCLSVNKFENGIEYSGGTTNLKNHDQKYHGDASSSGASQSEGIPGFTNPHCGKKWAKSSVQWKNATMSLVKWFVKNSRPTNLVKDSGFVDFIGLLCPEYQLPCPSTITKYMENLFEKKRKEVVDELSEVEWFSVISDGGSSSNQMSFQDNQVAYIDEDMNLKVKILGVKENKGDHDAEVYRERVDADLDEFSIQKSQVAQFVTDSEPKMSAAFREDRSGCLAHIIHKTCERGLSNEIAENVMSKWRAITTHNNTSYKFKYQYIKAQEEAKLPVKRLQADVCHRWGSVKASIESALPSDADAADKDQYFKVLNETLLVLSAASKKKAQKKKLKDLVLTQSDMNRLKSIHKLLKSLDVATTVLGMNRRPTGSLVLPIIETIKKKVFEADLDDSPAFIEDMKRDMLEDFTDRVAQNVNLEVMRNASALDPCEKKLKFLKSKPARKVVQSRLLRELRELKSKEIPADEEEGIKEPVEKRKRFGINYSDSEEDETPDDLINIEQEWNMYLEEPECSYDEDPLQWWRERKAKYPNVVRLARKYLCIPATSVEAERTFSALGLLLSKRRLAMTAEHASMQMFLKDKL